MRALALAEPEVHWEPQPGPQTWLIQCPVFEVFFGGARGGGKTDGILGDWIAHEDEHGANARGLLVRRELVQLDDIIERSKELFGPMGWTWHEQKKTWVSTKGAILRFRQVERDDDAAKYQGHAYTRVYAEELTNWPTPGPILKLFGALRSAHGVDCGFRATGNPGGPGHNWVKARYIDPAPRGLKVIRDDQGLERVFIPSRLEDNPALRENDPGYESRLSLVGSPEMVKAWRDGRWDIVAGGALDDLWNPDRHVLAPFAIPAGWTLDRSFDWGSSKPSACIWWAESNGDPAKMPDGSERHFKKGTVFAVAERYGWNGKPNEGSRELAQVVAADILLIQSVHPALKGRTVNAGPADPAIFAMEDGKSIESEMRKAGVRWIAAPAGPGSRVAGLEQVRTKLAAARVVPMEEPGLFVFETCVHGVRTLPTLPRDSKKPDDVDTNAEDHWYDSARYRLSVAARGGMSFGPRLRG